MKLFIAIVAAATVVGGFVGGELTGTTFTLSGAVVGGVGTAAVLLGLGAYFDSQERKRRDTALPPEVRAVFDRMTAGKQQSSSAHPSRPSAASIRNRVPGASAPPLELGAVIRDLIAQDAAAAARGEAPPRRLIPHHAIKRDVAIAAYRKDLEVALEQLGRMNWTEDEKRHRQSEITRDFDAHIAGLNRLGPEELGKLMVVMKQTRTDFKDIEQQVRENNPVYGIVAPL